MELKAKRILALALAAVLTLLILPVNGVLEAKAASTTTVKKEIVLYDDALAEGITAENGTQTEGAGTDGSAALKGAGYGWLKLKYGANQDWSDAAAAGGTLKFDIKSGYWGSAAGKVKLVANNTEHQLTDVAMPSATGVWTTIEIPLSSFADADFAKVTRVEIYTEGSGQTTYVDNICVTWEEEDSIALVEKDIVLYGDALAEGVTSIGGTQTEGAGTAGSAAIKGAGYGWLKLNYGANQDWSEAAAKGGSLKFDIKSGYWNSAVGKVKLNAGGAVYTVDDLVMPSATGVWTTMEISLSSFAGADFTKVTGVEIYTEGSGQSTYVDNIRIAWKEEAVVEAVEQTITLYGDALAEGVTSIGGTQTEGAGTDGSAALKGAGYGWLKLNYGSNQNWSDAAAGSGTLKFDIKSGYWNSTVGKVKLIANGAVYTVDNLVMPSATGVWTTMEISLSSFAGADFTKVTGVEIYTEGSGQSTYVDNICVVWETLVSTELQIDEQPVGADVLAYEAVTLSVAASVSGGSNAAIEYQWYQCDEDKANPVAIQGATAAEYDMVPQAEGTAYYYCTVSSKGLTSVDSQVVSVHVKPNKSFVLFDDAFCDSVKAADTANAVVTADIPAADDSMTSVIALSGGWDVCRFGTGATPVNLTAIAAGSGNLVLDIFASYATTDSEIRIYTGAWQSAATSFIKELNQGWNTITIPVSEIGSNDFYGIGIVSHTGTCYVDNVRFAWAVDPAAEKIVSSSVTLEAALGVNFKAPSGYTVEVTVGGESYAVTENNGVYSVSVFAQNMTGDIVATLTDLNGNTVDTVTFTLSDYVADINAGSYSQEIKALANATLDYCQYAATLKGSYDGELNQLGAIAEDALASYKITASGNIKGINAFAYLEDACQLALRLPEGEGYAVTVNGEAAELIGNVCYAPEILSQDYDADYTFVVTKDGAEYCRVSISVLTYLGNAFRLDICGENTDMENLLIAMYHYYAAAEAVSAQ